MFKLYKNKTNFVTKGITALGASGLGTMIPMHVNAASTNDPGTTAICLCGGVAILGFTAVVLYAFCSKDNNFDPDCREAVELNEKFNRPAIKDETTSAKQYFKLVNKK